jgi:putative DNA primase/helicase
MGVAKGIETAFCASLRFQIPAWVAISAIGLERWTPPTGIDQLIIFGDNDTSHTGQASALV